MGDIALGCGFEVLLFVFGSLILLCLSSVMGHESVYFICVAMSECTGPSVPGPMSSTSVPTGRALVLPYSLNNAVRY